jgi:exopolysaccharide biosynthesis polyprenyl glycosylphosphotransferase
MTHHLHTLSLPRSRYLAASITGDSRPYEALVTIHSVMDIEERRPTADAVNRLLDHAARPFHRQLAWMWRHGFRFLFVIDAVVLFAIMALINLVRFGTEWPTYRLGHYAIGFAVATTLHLAINYFSGLYEREPRLGSRPWLPRVSLAMVLGVAVDGLVAVLFDRYLMPRLNLGLLLVVGSTVLTGTRYLSRRLANRRRGPARVILVGEAADRVQARTALSRPDSDGVVVGEAESVASLFDAVSSTEATDVLLLDLTAFSAAFPEPITTLDRLGLGLHQRVSAAETLMGLRTIGEVGGVPITRLRPHSLAGHQERLKRLMDLVLVIGAAPIWLPVVGVLALYVRLVAGGPVLYRQTRVGLDDLPFELHKFRTMVRDAEAASGPRLSEAQDVRVLPRLRWLRRSRLDELPQLWNVLTGQMSLVGPRPERPEFVTKISQQVPGYSRRHSVRPGITGLAQVRGRYETDAAHKLGYDLQYLVNWSIMLDLQLITRAVSAKL